MEIKREAFGWLEMLLAVFEKKVFEFKILQEICKILARFHIQKVFRKKRQLESVLLIQNAGNRQLIWVFS